MTRTSTLTRVMNRLDGFPCLAGSKEEATSCSCRHKLRLLVASLRHAVKRTVANMMSSCPSRNENASDCLCVLVNLHDQFSRCK